MEKERKERDGRDGRTALRNKLMVTALKFELTLYCIDSAVDIATLTLAYLILLLL